MSVGPSKGSRVDLGPSSDPSPNWGKVVSKRSAASFSVNAIMT